MSGESTTRTSASSWLASSASHVPWTSSVSPVVSAVSRGGSVSPWRWMARINSSPLLATIPGKTFIPMAPERGGSRRAPNSPTMAMLPSSSGTPNQPILEKAEAAQARIGGCLRDDNVDWRTGQDQQRSGVRSKGQRHQQQRGRAFQAQRQDDY